MVEKKKRTQRVSLRAEARSADGKGGARRIRRDGLVPAIVYAGGKDATSISLRPLDLGRALLGPWRRNALIELEILDAAGKSTGTKDVMVRELQKHPLKRNALHVDFVEVDLNGTIDVLVPFEITGRSQAQIAGGRLHTPRRELRLRCKPDAIPEKVVLDSTLLDWGAHRAAIITAPAGTELLDDANLTILTISRPRGEAEEVVEDAAVVATPDAPAA